MQVRRRCGGKLSKGVWCSLCAMPSCSTLSSLLPAPGCASRAGRRAANTLNSNRSTFITCQAAGFGQWYGGDITHLELILMPVVDLRAGDTTWLSSDSTDWRRLSFTMYWLLLVGCHSTPKILKKAKQGEKMQPLLSSPLPRRLLSSPLAAQELSSPQSHLLRLQNVGKENPEEPNLFPDVGEGSNRRGPRREDALARG